MLFVNLSLAAFAVAMAGGTTSGQLTGVVVDATGAVIPGGANVRLTDPVTQDVRYQVNASNAGTFRFEAVASGDYFLSLNLPFFYERVEAVRVADGRVLDAGRVQLSVVPCEAPGMHCEEQIIRFKDGLPVPSEESLPGVRRPEAPKVLTLCEALAGLDPTRAGTWPVIVVGYLTRTERGSTLRSTCASDFVTNGYAWPNAIALAATQSTLRTDFVSTGNWESLDSQGAIRSLAIRSKDGPLAGAPIAAVYGRLQVSNPRLSAPCPDGPACAAGVSPVSAPAILVYEGPASIHIFEPPK